MKTQLTNVKWFATSVAVAATVLAAAGPVIAGGHGGHGGGLCGGMGRMGGGGMSGRSFGGLSRGGVSNFNKGNISSNKTFSANKFNSSRPSGNSPKTTTFQHNSNTAGINKKVTLPSGVAGRNNNNGNSNVNKLTNHSHGNHGNSIFNNNNGNKLSNTVLSNNKFSHHGLPGGGSTLGGNKNGNNFAKGNFSHSGHHHDHHGHNGHHHHNHIPFFGVYPFFAGYGNYGYGYNNCGYTNVTYVTPVTPVVITDPSLTTGTPVAAPAVDDSATLASYNAPVTAGPAVDGIDLELVNLQLVDKGDVAKQLGPRYRVTFRNAGKAAIDHEFNVALVASVEENPTATNLPTTESRISSVTTGNLAQVDLRLPASALEMGSDMRTEFARLFVILDSRGEVDDANRDNDAAGLDRAAIEPAT